MDDFDDKDDDLVGNDDDTDEEVSEDLEDTPYPEQAGYIYGEGASTLKEGELFSGDYGSFPVETRRLLAVLLKGPYIDGQLQPDLYATLLREESLARRWLGQVFLELVVDRDTKIAFTRQLDTYEYKVPMLMRRHKLQFLESVLILFLRQRLTQSTYKGERAVITGKDIHTFLEGFNKRRANDPARFQKQVNGAMFKFVNKYRLLKKLQGTGERYEISPVLKIIFQIEDIVSLTGVYRDELSKVGVALEEFASDGARGEVIEEKILIEDDDFPEDPDIETEFFEEEEDLEDGGGAVLFTEFYSGKDDDDDLDDDGSSGDLTKFYSDEDDDDDDDDDDF
jgi:hypothetical protein